METPTERCRLSEPGAGLHKRAAPALVMLGRWGLASRIALRGGGPFSVLHFNRAYG